MSHRESPDGDLFDHNLPVRDFESGAPSGPKREVLDRYSEPKHIVIRARARVRDNRDLGGQERIDTVAGWVTRGLATLKRQCGFDGGVCKVL